MPSYEQPPKEGPTPRSRSPVALRGSVEVLSGPAEIKRVQGIGVDFNVGAAVEKFFKNNPGVDAVVVRKAEWLMHEESGFGCAGEKRRYSHWWRVALLRRA